MRRKFSRVIISVDGGVNLESAPVLIQAGANRLVSGSAIFESNDIKRAIERLKIDKIKIQKIRWRRFTMKNKRIRA